MLIEIKSALDILINKYTDTDLSTESVLEVEVKQRGGGLWSNGGLKVELVSLQDVINVFGLPVHDSPEKCTMIRTIVSAIKSNKVLLCGNLWLNNADNILLTLALSNISSDVLTPSFQQDIIVLLPPSSDRHHHQPGLPQLTEKRQTSQSYKNNRAALNMNLNLSPLLENLLSFLVARNFNS